MVSIFKAHSYQNPNLFCRREEQHLRDILQGTMGKTDIFIQILKKNKLSLNNEYQQYLERIWNSWKLPWEPMSIGGVWSVGVMTEVNT